MNKPAKSNEPMPKSTDMMRKEETLKKLQQIPPKQRLEILEALRLRREHHKG